SACRRLGRASRERRQAEHERGGLVKTHGRVQYHSRRVLTKALAAAIPNAACAASGRGNVSGSVSELRKLPKVDRLAEASALAPLRSALGRATVVAIVREVLSNAREDARAGRPVVQEEELVERVRAAAARRLA